MGCGGVRRSIGVLGVAVALAPALAGPSWSAPGDEYRARYQVYAMVPQSSSVRSGLDRKGLA